MRVKVRYQFTPNALHGAGADAVLLMPLSIKPLLDTQEAIYIQCVTITRPASDQKL